MGLPDNLRAVRGMQDCLPEASARFRWVENAARDLFARYACGEIRTPIVEPTLLFERGVGQGTDIVNKEMFYVPSKDEGPGGEHRMVLRPEATASVARAYVEHDLAKAAPGLQRFYYIGPMFRYERPQKGRLRQFTQIGVEFLSSPEPRLDAEAITLLVDLLNALPTPPWTLMLNSVGCPVCRPAYIEKLRAFAYTQSSALCDDCRTRAEQNPLRLFDCKQAGCRAVLAQAPLLSNDLCGGCRDHQAAVLGALGRLNIPVTLEPRLMRGLDYYTRTVFEVVLAGLGAQNAVAAGGRYDKLVAELGGEATPAFGWSLGVERLLEAVTEAPPADPLDLLVADPGPDPVETFVRVTALRRQGLSVRLDPDVRSVKARMKQADRLGARFALFVQPDGVELKELASGRQLAVAWEAVRRTVRPEAASEVKA